MTDWLARVVHLLRLMIFADFSWGLHVAVLGFLSCAGAAALPASRVGRVKQEFLLLKGRYSRRQVVAKDANATGFCLQAKFFFG